MNMHAPHLILASAEAAHPVTSPVMVLAELVAVTWILSAALAIACWIAARTLEPNESHTEEAIATQRTFWAKAALACIALPATIAFAIPVLLWLGVRRALTDIKGTR